MELLNGKMGSDHYYQLTCVVNNLQPVFSQPQIVRIVMDSWLYQKLHNKMSLYSYVVMEEHLHFLAQAPDLELCLNSFLEQTSAGIVCHLSTQGLERFLEKLPVDNSGYGSQLWQPAVECELVTGDENMQKIIDYIHINPVKRGYVDNVTDWRYSSARNYAGENGLIEVDRWK